MSDPDGPEFLSSPPVSAEPEASLAASPYRKAQPPTEPIPPRPPTWVEPPAEPPLPPPPEVSFVDDQLARWLGPGRMPWVLMHYPRISGLVLFAFGGWLGRDIAHVITDGGRYTRVEALLAPMFTLLGSYLLVAGRPHDREGFAPGWWNVGYMLTVMAGFVAGGMILTLFL